MAQLPLYNNIVNFALTNFSQNRIKMHNSKRIISRVLTVVAILIASSLPVNAQISKGEKSLGPRIGYVSRNKSAIAGLVFQYAFSQHFRVAPEIGYIFRHNNYDASTVDLNVHIPFGFTGEKVSFYPLAGINYSSWSHHYRDNGLNSSEIIESKDVSTRKARFGLNVGAGFDMRCSETLKLSLEAKYIIIKGYTTAMICAGISYVF